jgi:hypothetical protein
MVTRSVGVTALDSAMRNSLKNAYSSRSADCPTPEDHPRLKQGNGCFASSVAVSVAVFSSSAFSEKCPVGHQSLQNYPPPECFGFEILQNFPNWPVGHGFLKTQQSQGILELTWFNGSGMGEGYEQKCTTTELCLHDLMNPQNSACCDLNFLRHLQILQIFI